MRVRPILVALLLSAVLAPAVVASPPPHAARGGSRSGDPSGTVCGGPAKRVVRVASSAELHAALSVARPGDRIQLADGRYPGTFVIERSGTPGRRIRLCGTRAAVLEHGLFSTGRGLHIKASYWDLHGFTVTNAKKGVLLDGASFNVLSDLEVHTIGEEAIRLRAFSTDNRVAGSHIHNTGLKNYKYGEGVYVGSPVDQWCQWTGCRPDNSDRNMIVDNSFAYTTAEPIDIKEGTRSGVIEGNTFDGTGMLGRAWVNVKGNNWLVRNNAGSSSPLHGFLTEVAEPGWGTLNSFVGNVADVKGTGYGFSMRPGNIVGCDNVVTNAALGMSNIECTARL